MKTELTGTYESDWKAIENKLNALQGWIEILKKGQDVTDRAIEAWNPVVEMLAQNLEKPASSVLACSAKTKTKDAIISMDEIEMDSMSVVSGDKRESLLKKILEARIALLKVLEILEARTE